MRLAAGLLLIVGACNAARVTPILAVNLENALPRPGRSGRAPFVRPLLLFVSNWQTPAPRVQATSYGDIKAECTRLPATAGRWAAAIRFTLREDAEHLFEGNVKLDLRIEDAIVRGTYEGAYNNVPIRGRPGAGLAFQRDLETPNSSLLLWMPHLQQNVRGLVIIGNGGEVEKREAALAEASQAFATANRLALAATAGLPSSFTEDVGGQILDGLEKLGELSGHPEFASVPIFFMGHSGGGTMSAVFNQRRPSRIAGYIDSHGGGLSNLSPDALANPGLYTAGENDPKMKPSAIESNFVWLRLSGAHVSLIVEQGQNHPMGPGAMPLFLYTLQRLVDHRLPIGAAHLKPVDDTAAWIADNATWKSGITRIMPLSGTETSARPQMPPGGIHLDQILVGGHIDFSLLPLPLRLSWLIDEDVAYVYRGAATYNNPLVLERAGDHAASYLANEPVSLRCTDFGAGDWKSVSVYDGARLLGRVTTRNPNLTLPRQRPGAHAGVLVGELANGELRTSLPVLWSVWP